jgi:hypothetical protein
LWSRKTWTKSRYRRRCVDLVAAVALAAGLITLADCASVPKRHPALAVVARFEAIGPSPQSVQPYFANLFALSLSRHERHLDEVTRYIDWYLDHLNGEDETRPAGTIDDYEIHHGNREQSLESYDSADGYAGTFLILLDAYEQATGDTELLNAWRAEIVSIAELLLALQNEDGLVRVSPEDGTHYLMDNCEAYGGLLAWSALERRLGWDAGPRYLAAAERLRLAIMDRLYDPATHRFHWAESGDEVHESSWDTYYPDAMAQLFPVLYGVIPAGKEPAQSLWREFATRYDPRGDDDVPSSDRALIELTRERVEQ